MPPPDIDATGRFFGPPQAAATVKRNTIEPALMKAKRKGWTPFFGDALPADEGLLVALLSAWIH